MRRGATPREAALEACRRIVARTKAKRLLDDAGRPRFNVKIYALRADGEHGAASLWSGAEYALKDAEAARLLPAAHLFER
jgi:N4-(beta-N-acetylglucosaminyl)-L-asparaginase